jgi:hypothetical protein
LPIGNRDRDREIRILGQEKREGNREIPQIQAYASRSPQEECNIWQDEFSPADSATR